MSPNVEIRMIAALMAVPVAANLVCAATIEAAGQDWPEILTLAAFAVSFAGIGLCSINLVWGPANLVLRTAALLLAVGSAGLVFAIGTRTTWTIQDVRVWCTILEIYTVYVAGPLGIARLVGLIATETPAQLPRMRSQFSLGWALSLMTAIALLLAASMRADLSGEYTATMGGVLALSFGCVTWLCVGTATTERWTGIVHRMVRFTQAKLTTQRPVARELSCSAANRLKFSTHGLASICLTIASFVGDVILVYIATTSYTRKLWMS